MKGPSNDNTLVYEPTVGGPRSCLDFEVSMPLSQSKKGNKTYLDKFKKHLIR